MGLQVPELVSSWATVKQPLGVTCVSYCEKKKKQEIITMFTFTWQCAKCFTYIIAFNPQQLYEVAALFFSID